MNNLDNFSRVYERFARPTGIIALLAIVYFAMVQGAMAACVTSEGTPVVGARVQLDLYADQYFNYTNDTGCYILKDVPNGTYAISASKSGFVTNTTTITTPETQGYDFTQDFILSAGYPFIASGQAYGGQWRTDFRVGNLGTQAGRIDVNFINASGVIKATSSDVISNMTSIDYVWSSRVTIPYGDVEGSATIISEQPIDVISMQRSNSAGKLGFFEGASLNTQGTQWFVPGLAYGGQWRTGFKVLNLGDTAATVNLKFYNSAGTEINNITNIILAKASPYYDWYTYGYVPGSSAVEGTAIVTSNTGQPLNIVASQASESIGKLGFWNGIYLNDQKTEVFAPGLVHGGQWRSGFKVSNLGASEAIVDMYFYDSNGAQINSIQRNIPAKASRYYDWYTYGYLVTGATDGTARINSNGMPVYVVVSQASENPGMLDFYPAAELNGNKTAGLIYMKFEGGERSGFKIANPSQTSSLTATIRFYNTAGEVFNTITNTPIGAKSSPFFAWPTSEPSGSVTVEATNRISAVGYIASETESKLGIFKGIKN